MTSPIIAFLAGAGTGYLKQRNIEDQRKRDEEDQQFRNEQRAVWRKEQADADNLKQSLQQAQAPAEVVEGPLGDQSAGPPPPVALTQGGAGQPAAATFRMVAPGLNKTFTSAAEAQQAAADYAKPEAVNQRVVAAYRGAGLADKALEMERNANQGQLAKLQLDEATQARADKAWDQGLAAAATNADSLAKYFSGSPLVGGNEVRAVPAADGKSVQFFSVGADGKQTALYQPVGNDPTSWAPLLTQLSRSLSPEARLQHLYRLDETRRLQANADREFELKQQLRADDRDYKNRVLALRGTGSGSGAGKGGAAETASFDPLSDFDPKQARKAAMDMALEEAKNSTGTQPMGEKQIAARAQAIYAGLRDAAAADNSMRQRASVFATAAKAAKTEDEVQAVKERAIQSGFTEEEMGRIDSRFAPPAPAPAKAAGTPKAAIQRAPIAAQVGSNPDPVASREAYQQFLINSGHKAAAERGTAGAAATQNSPFIAASEYEAAKLAERRRIAQGMEELRRGAAARLH